MKSMVSFSKVRLYIVVTFVLSFVLIVTFLFVGITKELFPKERYFLPIVLLLLKNYSVPFAVIIGAAFFNGDVQTKLVATPVFIIGLSLCVIWNLLFLSRIILFDFSQTDEVTDMIQYFRDVFDNGSFLIAGVLAYFFSKS